MTVQSFVYESAEAASEACARKVLELLGRAVSTQPRATIAVSGGTTPKRMFADMARSGFDWTNVHLFWVDERSVPPTDPESNYKLAKEHFIDPAPFPQANVHRIQGELASTAAANLYAAVYVEKFHQWRVTLLPGVLEAARHTLTLAAGADKAEPLRSVLQGPYDPKKYPAQIATYDGAGAIWFLDKAAAGTAVRS